MNLGLMKQSEPESSRAFSAAMLRRAEEKAPKPSGLLARILRFFSTPVCPHCQHAMRDDVWGWLTCERCGYSE